MEGYVFLAVAAWIVIGVLLAARTGDDDGDFSRLGKVAMFVDRMGASGAGQPETGG